jgi:hypothetical protein
MNSHSPALGRRTFESIGIPHRGPSGIEPNAPGTALRHGRNPGGGSLHHFLSWPATLEAADFCVGDFRGMDVFRRARNVTMNLLFADRIGDFFFRLHQQFDRPGPFALSRTEIGIINRLPENRTDSYSPVHSREAVVRGTMSAWTANGSASPRATPPCDRSSGRASLALANSTGPRGQCRTRRLPSLSRAGRPAYAQDDGPSD